MYIIISYNCRGLPKRNKQICEKPWILIFCYNYDIIRLQETWYSKQDLHLLNIFA